MASSENKTKANSQEMILVDVEKEKVYKGTKNQIHYERFEDTIKYIDYSLWIKFIQFVKELEDANRLRNRLIFELLISTGMRIQEFSLIKVSDLDFQESMIRVPFENTKTKKRRTARVKRSLMLDLRDYLMSENIKSGFIFRNKTNKPLSTRYYQKIFDKYFLHSRLQEFGVYLDWKPHPHTFRHCHIVYSLQQGVPINAVMAQVGHLSINTTEIYSRLAGVDVAKGYEGVDF